MSERVMSERVMGETKISVKSEAIMAVLRGVR